MKTKSNGFAHVIALIVVVVLMGAAGAVFLTRSSAASCVDSQFRRGSSGTCVRHIQSLANHKVSPKLTVDGKFGPATDANIKAVQKKFGLKVDGIVGPQTWKTLCHWGIGPQKGAPFNSITQRAAINAGCAKLTTDY